MSGHGRVVLEIELSGEGIIDKAESAMELCSHASNDNLWTLALLFLMALDAGDVTGFRINRKE